MNKWVRSGRVIGIVDQSDTQSNGMLLSICYLDEYDFLPHEVEYHARLITNAEKMLELIQTLHSDELCKPYGEVLIERFLEDWHEQCVRRF